MIKRLLTALALMFLLASPADATTTHYNLTLPTVGASTNVWGTQLNTIFNTLDTDIWSVAGGFTIGANAQSSSANITLTAPAKNIQLITLTTTGKNLILPAMNITQSPVVGGTPLTVYNAGTNSFSVVAQDGTTAIVSGLLTGQFVNLYLTNAATANGTFVVSGPYSASGVGSGNFTTLSATGATTLSSTLAVTGASTFTGAINKVTITPPATGSTFTLADGKTFAVSNSLTFTGSDNTSFAFPASSDTVAALTATQTLTNKTLTAPTLTGITSGSTATTQSPGDSSTKIATTAFVNPGCTLGTTGSCQYPSGLIEKWTSIGPIGGGGGTWTFAVAFPNNCYNVVCTAQSGGAGASSVTANVSSCTTSGVALWLNGNTGGSFNFYCRALGN